MNGHTTRRQFLGRTAIGGAAMVGWHVGTAGRAASTSSLERLQIGAIGTGNRAANNIAACASESIVAICDVDTNFLDVAAGQYPQARQYKDFRVMLEQERDKLDAVIVATPDHTHAPAAAMAMRMGKHTYCEKPLTHTVFEARRLAELAAEQKLVTQMGTQIHAGSNYRRVVELVQSGTIGAVRECHVWVGVDYAGGKLHAAKQPKTVDWDLWLGPTAERDYVESTIKGQHQTVHPYHWRWFWAYGSGGLGDFGCHYMDLAHWVLQLKHPTRIVATGPPVDSEATTSGLRVNYQYPARGDLPPVELTWYDGGQKPEALSRFTETDGKPIDWASGQLFIGEYGAILSNYGNHRLLPADGAGELKRPQPYIPDSIGHHREWIDAIRNNGPTTCDFGYAGALTEAVLLGVVAYRSGEAIDWNAAQMRASNAPKAQSMLHTPYRDGWTL